MILVQLLFCIFSQYDYTAAKSIAVAKNILVQLLFCIFSTYSNHLFPFSPPPSSLDGGVIINYVHNKPWTIIFVSTPVKLCQVPGL